MGGWGEGWEEWKCGEGGGRVKGGDGRMGKGVEEWGEGWEDGERDGNVGRGVEVWGEG